MKVLRHARTCCSTAELDFMQFISAGITDSNDELDFMQFILPILISQRL